MPYKIILGSASPRRQHLLELAGFEFEKRPIQVEEHFPSNLEIREVPMHLALLKSHAHQKLAENELLITADTIVNLGGKLLGKPKDKSDALVILKQITGRSHEVITAVCLRSVDKLTSFSETTKVLIKKAEDIALEYYIEKYNPLDKAGSYGVQDWFGVRYVNRIEGCFYNVMGLPVSRLTQELRKFMPVP